MVFLVSGLAGCIDPLDRPTVPAGIDHYFRTCLRPYVRPQFTNYRKTKQTKVA